MNAKDWRVIVVCGFVAGLMVVVTAGIGPARADVGVKPILPGGSSIQPEDETPIQMASERVAINVRLATAEDNKIIQLNPTPYWSDYQKVWYPAVAMVVADFTMHNPTTSTIELETWFPLASVLGSVTWELSPDETVPAIASFQVMRNGVTLNYTVSEQPNPQGSDKPDLPWASFMVRYPPNADTQLTVSYLLPLTQAIKGSELLVYYVFQTGAGWAGPIGKAELVINLPYKASPDTIARVSPGGLSIPYDAAAEPALPSSAAMEGSQAFWTWTDFEPTALDDFAAWLVDPLVLEQLEEARANVKQQPDNRRAWLDLARLDFSLAMSASWYPSVFNDRYREEGIEAYTKVIELWPENPTPHSAIAMLMLSEYLPGLDAPADVMQSIQDHLQQARELEAEHPELMDEGRLQSQLVDDMLRDSYFGAITATAVYQASSTAAAKESQAPVGMVIASETPSPKASETLVPSASPTGRDTPPTPTVTGVPTQVDSIGRGLSIGVIFVAFMSMLFVALVVMGIALVFRSQRRE